MFDAMAVYNKPLEFLDRENLSLVFINAIHKTVDISDPNECQRSPYLHQFP